MDVNGRMVPVPIHSAVEELDINSDAAAAESKNLDQYLDRVSAVFEKFIDARYSRDIATAQELMSHLKDMLTALRSLPPSREGTPTDRELKLARDIHEWAVLMTGYSTDPAGAMIREFDQLKPYYSDEWKTLQPSRLKDFLFGRYLLMLLQENEFDKFHIELQSLSDVELTDCGVAYAVRIEKLLSEQAAREKTLSYKGIQETRTKLILRDGSVRQTLVRTPPAPAHPPFDLDPKGETRIEVRDG